MKYALPIMLLLLMASSADAGPFRRRHAQCGLGGCGNAISVDNSSAQAVAETNARIGQNAHRGGNSTYEGIGWGRSPQAALSACCSNRGRVVDQGVAMSADGRWFACKRYDR